MYYFLRKSSTAVFIKALVYLLTYIDIITHVSIYISHAYDYYVYERIGFKAKQISQQKLGTKTEDRFEVDTNFKEQYFLPGNITQILTAKLLK